MWPVVSLAGITGSKRQWPAISGAGCARDAKKPAFGCAYTATEDADLQVFYGSDGTRTRDLRRDSWASRLAVDRR